MCDVCIVASIFPHAYMASLGALGQPPPTTFNPSGVFTAGKHGDVHICHLTCNAYCKGLHCIKSVAINIVFSIGTPHSVEARPPSPKRLKACPSEGTIIGVCHDSMK